MADQRRKNVDWRVVDEHGRIYSGRYDASMLAVLMDIRDELQQINATLNCHNTRDIPRILRAIRAHTSRLPVRRKKG